MMAGNLNYMRTLKMKTLELEIMKLVAGGAEPAQPVCGTPCPPLPICPPVEIEVYLPPIPSFPVEPQPPSELV
jgi:hypothetical protein